MTDWLDKDILLNAIETVTTTDPVGIQCMEKRSDDPFDYVDLISSTLKFIGETTIKEFGEADRFSTRKKDNRESRKLRQEGDKMLSSKSDSYETLEKSFEIYSKSISYATHNSHEMALAIFARSTVLYQLSRPQECLEDVKRLLSSNNYPEESKYQLHVRQAECFSMLASDSYIQAKFWLNKVPANDPNLKRMKRDLRGYSAKDYEDTFDKEPVLPELESPRADIPCASDAIKVDGKKIVATRDILVAEVLVVEKPYLAHCIDLNHYYYCEFCLQSFWNGIPCDNCPNTMYCSEKCKTLAWQEYHSSECLLLNALLEHKSSDPGSTFTNYSVIATLKLLTKLIHEAGGLNELKERIKEFFKNNDGKVKSEWYANQTLESILALNSNIENIPEEAFEKQVAIAIHTLFYLATNSNLLGVRYNSMSDEEIVSLLSQNENAQFVGGLLIKLLLITRNNNIVATEKHKNIILPSNRGFFVPSFVQLINRSCYFNAVVQFIGEHVILHSVAPIKKGEEVLISDNSWLIVSKEKRLSKETSECSCKACEGNWPTFDMLKSYKCSEKAKSPQSRVKVDKVLQPLPALFTEICERNEEIKDYEKTLNILKEMTKVVYEEVELPCLEQGLLLKALAHFYHNSGATSKLRCRFFQMANSDNFDSIFNFLKNSYGGHGFTEGPKGIELL